MPDITRELTVKISPKLGDGKAFSQLKEHAAEFEKATTDVFERVKAQSGKILTPLEEKLKALKEQVRQLELPHDIRVEAKKLEALTKDPTGQLKQLHDAQQKVATGWKLAASGAADFAQSLATLSQSGSMEKLLQTMLIFNQVRAGASGFGNMLGGMATVAGSRLGERDKEGHFIFARSLAFGGGALAGGALAAAMAVPGIGRDIGNRLNRLSAVTLPNLRDQLLQTDPTGEQSFMRTAIYDNEQAYHADSGARFARMRMQGQQRLLYQRASGFASAEEEQAYMRRQMAREPYEREASMWTRRADAMGHDASWQGFRAEMSIGRHGYEQQRIQAGIAYGRQFDDRYLQSEEERIQRVNPQRFADLQATTNTNYMARLRELEQRAGENPGDVTYRNQLRRWMGNQAQEESIVASSAVFGSPIDTMRQARQSLAAQGRQEEARTDAERGRTMVNPALMSERMSLQRQLGDRNSEHWQLDQQRFQIQRAVRGGTGSPADHTTLADEERVTRQLREVDEERVRLRQRILEIGRQEREEAVQTLRTRQEESRAAAEAARERLASFDQRTRSSRGQLGASDPMDVSRLEEISNRMRQGQAVNREELQFAGQFSVARDTVERYYQQNANANPTVGRIFENFGQNEQRGELAGEADRLQGRADQDRQRAEEGARDVGRQNAQEMRGAAGELVQRAQEAGRQMATAVHREVVNAMQQAFAAQIAAMFAAGPR